MQDTVIIKLPIADLIDWDQTEYTPNDIERYHIGKEVMDGSHPPSLFLNSLNYDETTKTLGARTKLRDERHITFWIDAYTYCGVRFHQKVRLDPTREHRHSLRSYSNDIVVYSKPEQTLQNSHIEAKFL